MRSAAPAHQSSSLPVFRCKPATSAGLSATAGAKLIAAALLISFLAACGEPGEVKNTDPASTTNHQPATVNRPNVTITHTTIGSSGYSIDLPSSHKIETHQNTDFSMVYYFTPSDTLLNPGEAGMYFGPTPDVKPPAIDYTQTVLDTVFLGKKQKWVEYTTEKYVQRETFIDQGNDQYIHAWCYSNNAEELDRLFRMMLTIRK